MLILFVSPNHSLLDAYGTGAVRAIGIGIAFLILAGLGWLLKALGGWLYDLTHPTREDVIGRGSAQKPQAIAGDGRRSPLTDAEIEASVKNIATVLGVSMNVSGPRIEDANGQFNRKALGYVYGFVDAALRYRGIDMADASVGVQFLYLVFNRLFKDNNRARAYTDFLIQNAANDPTVMLGVMHGGQQYIDWRNSGGEKAPMGFGRFILEGDAR